MRKVQKVLVLAVLCLAQGAWGQKPDINWFANNSEADTLYIATANELAGLAALVNNTAGVGQAINFSGKTIILTKDINLSAYGANYNNKKGWIPIGSEFSFNGTFDGDGKKITGLYMNYKECKPNSCENIGLFGLIRGGGVKNLGVENVNITGKGDVGGIVGSGGNSQIYNCYSTGKVTGHSTFDSYYGYAGGSGGIVGNGIVMNSYTSAVVNGEYSVGGIAGKGFAHSSYSTGTVKGNYIVGGIVGDGIVHYSYSTGTISGKSNVGGIAGSGEITNSYSTGAVKGDKYVGGIAGSGDVTNSYSTGSISGKDYVGGIAGHGDVHFSYSTSAIKGDNYVGGIAGSGNVDHCVALNPSVKATGKHGRINGSSGESVGNAAFNGMTNNLGNTLWLNKGLMSINGKDITNISINTDGTIGDRFTSKEGWVIENGKLPGLQNKTVDLPKHLKLSEKELADINQKREQEPDTLDNIEPQNFFIDSRDDKKYKIVEIGEQTWMAENLNFETYSHCYYNDSANCEKYGRLYDWETAYSSCPKGWHLLTEEE